MAKRLNISISDKLSKELKENKQQLPNKVSKICQAALWAVIKQLEEEELKQVRNSSTEKFCQDCYAEEYTL